MPLSIQCPTCKVKLNAPDSAVGKRVKCPKCQTPVAVPGQMTGVKSPAAPVAATAPTPAKPVALPPMPAPRAAKAAAPAAAANTPAQPASPPAATPAAPVFPVVAASPKPAAKAKSGFGVLLLILAAVAGGGLLLCMGGIAAVVMFFLQSNEPAPSAPNTVAAAAGPALPVEPPRDISTESSSAERQASKIEWIPYEDNAAGFKAVFPGGRPQPLDPLASVEEPQQRELVAAMMKEWTVLGVTHDGRKYTLTAAPLALGGIPANTYLDRMAGGLRAIHSGFSLEKQPSSDDSAPLRDYVLKKDDAGKLLRVVASGGHVYQLLIEGEAGLAFSDPAAKEFFERFEGGGISSAAVASSQSGRPKSKTKSKTKRSDEPAEEIAEALDSIDWLPLTGGKFAFTISFPDVPGRVENPLSLLPAEGRPRIQENWTRDGVTVESYSAQVGDRRYGVTMLHDPNLREEGSIRFRGQIEGLIRSFAQDLYQDVRDRGIRGRNPKVKWEQHGIQSMTLQDGSKAIVRQAYLGHYGFVVRVEGPATMDDRDPQVHKFFDSLEPPPDATPLPLNVKALPGQRTGKTKKK